MQETSNNTSTVKGLGVAEVPFQLSSLKLGLRTRVSYRSLSVGGKQDGSRMIVVCESMLTCAYACVCVVTKGVWGHVPQENFEFRSSQIASDTIWDKLSKQHFDDTYLHVCPVTC